MTSNDLSQEYIDQRFLEAALRLARKHQGQTGTNPSVACIIVADLPHGNCIVGSGVTAKGGRPHAEPPALEEAGELARGATAYVTLEPCAHHGKTPPCAQNLIDSGIARVVTAVTDPDSRVNGKGHQMLIDAGVEVTAMNGGPNALRVLQAYLKAKSCARPFVILKMAMDESGLIGSTAAGNLKISGSVAMGVTHLVRARSHAILVGSKTVLIDDPDLRCRLPGLKDRSPIRIALDAKGQLQENSQFISKTRQTQTIIVAPLDVSPQWRKMLVRNGAQHQVCEMHGDKIALPELLDDLCAQGIQSIMVEGGATIAKSFLEDDLVDEIILHIGGEPQTLTDETTGVYASFTPDSLPEGFEVCQTLYFGADKSLRLRKK